MATQFAGYCSGIAGLVIDEKMKIDGRDFCEKSSRKDRRTLNIAFYRQEIYNSRLKNISTSLINQKTNKEDKLSLLAYLRRGRIDTEFFCQIKTGAYAIYFNLSQRCRALGQS